METHDAVAAGNAVHDHARDLAEVHRDIGRICDDYACAVDEHHQQIDDQLASFIEWTVGIESVGFVIGVFTATIGEAPTQAVEGARIASAAATVRTILVSLIEVAETAARAIGEALSEALRLAGEFAKFLAAGVRWALVKVGLREAEEELPELTSGARRLQAKYKHAAVFGLTDNYNPENGVRFKNVLDDFLASPKTTRVRGTFKTIPVILNYQKTTRNIVVQTTSGELISCWKLGQTQFRNVVERRSL